VSNFEILMLALQLVQAPALWALVRVLWRLDRRLYRVELHLGLASEA